MINCNRTRQNRRIARYLKRSSGLRGLAFWWRLHAVVHVFVSIDEVTLLLALLTDCLSLRTGKPFLNHFGI